MRSCSQVLGDQLGVQLNGQGKRSVRLVEGRIQDPDAVKALVEGTDAVICCTGSRRGPDGNAPGTSAEVSCRSLLDFIVSGPHGEGTGFRGHEGAKPARAPFCMHFSWSEPGPGYH